MKINIHGPSIVIGTAATLLALLSMGQMNPNPNEAWPPVKRAIVNVYAQPSGGSTLPPGGTVVVYTVPPDRWVTITGAYCEGNGEWTEEFNGAFTPKGVISGLPASGSEVLFTPAGSGGPVGWTFRPGSKVVIRNPFSAQVSIGRYAVIGYESRG